MIIFRLLFLGIILFIPSVSTNAQPGIQWAKAYGGTSYEAAGSILQTLDGGYIIGGSTQSFSGDVTGNHGGIDYWVVKLSATGSIQWQRTYGGNGDEWLYKLIQTNDGGFILAGTSDSASGDVSSIHGHAQNDYWIVKISSAGAIEWENSYGGTLGDFPNSIEQTSDGGYIVAGHSNSVDGNITLNHGDFDGWVVKLSATGVIQWQRSYGGSDDDKIFSILQTPDGGYVISGRSASIDGDVVGNHGSYDIWVVKLSPIGSIEWQKSYGGSRGEFQYDIRQTLDGGYVVVGGSSSSDGDLSGFVAPGSSISWLLKLSSAGIIQWQKSLSVGALAIRQTPDSGYLVAGGGQGPVGHGTSDFGIAKLSSTGIEQWSATYGGSDHDIAFGLSPTTDGGCIVVGLAKSNDIDVHGYHGGGDIWVVKLNAVSGLQNIGGGEMVTFYPNPTMGQVSVNGVDQGTVRIYNCTGEEMIGSTDIKNISLKDVPPGMYFARVFDNNGQLISVQKLIKI